MRPKRRWKKTRAVLLFLALGLLALRLYLPTMVRDGINGKLSSLEGYEGRVSEVSLGILRGRVVLEGLRVERRGTSSPVAALTAEAVAVNIEWGPLLRRMLLANVYVGRPVLHLVKPSEAPAKEAAAPAAKSAPRKLRALPTFELNHLEVKDGEIHYIDSSTQPNLDVALTEIEVHARELRNTASREALPSDVSVKAKALGTGRLEMSLKAAPMREEPTFELKHELTGVELVKLNDLLDAYAKVKVKSGVFGLYAEAAGKDGKFIGYAKPVVKDMILDKTRGGNVGKEALAVVASAVKWLIENKRKDQIATKIPIEGTFEDKDVGVWAAVGGILKNAYIKALSPSLDGVGAKLKDVSKVKK